MYNGYIVKVEHLRPHTNADKLQILTVFGLDTCVDLNVSIGDIGLYLPTDGQISVEFAETNNLLRKKDDAGNNIGGFIDADKRNITAIRLRGERSEGLYLPIHCLDYCFDDLDASAHLSVGDRIDVVNGHEICCKYIPRTNKSSRLQSNGNKTRKTKIHVSPLFKEHADTEQLPYNLGAFKVGDEIEITLKMHGTSQRTGYLPVLKGYKRTFLDWLFRREGKPVYDWGYVSGTRRVVLENYDGGFYGSNEFREQHSKIFEGKLNKGETVYYEVVGFTTNGTPIMSSANNAKLQDKEFIKQYGKETVFSYGCHPDGVNHLTVNDGEGDPFFDPRPQSDIYVYRMTMTNEDGFVVEYTPDFMRYRCEQMGIKTVPSFGNAIISEDRLHFVAPDGYDHDYRIGDGTIGDMVLKLAEEYYDGPDPIGKTHVREGVVVRITNRPNFTAYKHKNFSFKVLEGIAKVEADAPDIEEAQEVTDNE